MEMILNIHVTSSMKMGSKKQRQGTFVILRAQGKIRCYIGHTDNIKVMWSISTSSPGCGSLGEPLFGRATGHTDNANVTWTIRHLLSCL